MPTQNNTRLAVLAAVALLVPNAVRAQVYPGVGGGGYATIQLEGGLGDEICPGVTLAGTAACPTMAVPNNAWASSFGTGTSGSVLGNATLRGPSIGGVWASGIGYAMDYISFGSGIVPSDIVFWLAVETSWRVSAPPMYGYAAWEFEANWGSGSNFIGTSSNVWWQEYNIPNPGLGPLNYYNPQAVLPSPSPQPGGPLTVPTNGSSNVRFYLSAQAMIGVLPGQTGRATPGASVTNAARIAAIQFFSNGVDVSSQVSATFASGHQYHVGAPVTPVPEPSTIVLLATGLAAILGLQWKRRLAASRVRD